MGFASGALQILDAYTLQSEEDQCLQCSQDAITHLTFSQDSLYLAAAVSYINHPVDDVTPMTTTVTPLPCTNKCYLTCLNKC